MKRYLVITTILVLSLVTVLGCAQTEPATEETTPETPQDGFSLTVTEPADESIVNTDRVQVSGITTPGAVVSVNGDLTEVDAKGSFSATVVLEEGPNLIEVIASDTQGNQQSQPIAVIFEPSDGADTDLFLTIARPADNSTTSRDRVEVEGSTIPGAVVSVNGDLTEVDAKGGFSTTVVLEEGPNLIEVIASDLEGKEASRTLAVIYIP